MESMRHVVRGMAGRWQRSWAGQLWADLSYWLTLWVGAVNLRWTPGLDGDGGGEVEPSDEGLDVATRDRLRLLVCTGRMREAFNQADLRGGGAHFQLLKSMALTRHLVPWMSNHALQLLRNRQFSQSQLRQAVLFASLSGNTLVFDAITRSGKLNMAAMAAEGSSVVLTCYDAVAFHRSQERKDGPSPLGQKLLGDARINLANALAVGLHTREDLSRFNVRGCLQRGLDNELALLYVMGSYAFRWKVYQDCLSHAAQTGMPLDKGAPGMITRTARQPMSLKRCCIWAVSTEVGCLSKRPDLEPRDFNKRLNDELVEKVQGYDYLLAYAYGDAFYERCDLV